MSAGPTVLLVAGEASGDLHGARLAEAFRRCDPDVRLVGVGGQRMHEAGVEILTGIESLSVVGITEVARRLPRILRILGALGAHLKSGEIDLFVPIDYPDFNFRLARTAHAAGVPVFYFIAPQVWAWRRGRVREMARWCAHVAVLFPFEVPFFEAAGVPVTYAGHPLVTELSPTRDRAAVRAALGLGSDERLVALLPGSRHSEIERHLPIMTETARRLGTLDPPVRCAVARAATLDREEVIALAPGLEVVEPPAIDLASAADAAIVASGTATVEVAIAGTPMVVMYRLSRATWFVARRLVKTPYAAMVNLVAEERLVPELLQDDASPERLTAEVRRLLDEPRVGDRMREGYARVRAALGGGVGLDAIAETALSLRRTPV